MLTEDCLLTQVDSVLTTLDVEAGLALPANHQVLVVGDQAGAEVTGWCRVGRGREDVLRTVGGAVGGEVVILDETAVTVSTVEVVGQTALLNNNSFNTQNLPSGGEILP